MSLQRYGCAVLYTVNVEEERIYTGTKEKKTCKLQMTQRVKNHSFQKC